MLGWFGLDDDADPGAADRILEDLALRLQATGLRIAGAVQRNLPADPGCACDMDVVVIGEEDRPIRISQSLGRGSSGCRLDAGALETAAGRVASRLAGAEVLILPKFGRQEAAGRGFRSVIAQAAADGVPVLLHVPAEQRAAWLGFCGGLGERVAPEGLTDWCVARTTEAR